MPVDFCGYPEKGTAALVKSLSAIVDTVQAGLDKSDKCLIQLPQVGGWWRDAVRRVLLLLHSYYGGDVLVVTDQKVLDDVFYGASSIEDHTRMTVNMVTTEAQAKARIDKGSFRCVMLIHYERAASSRRLLYSLVGGGLLVGRKNNKGCSTTAWRPAYENLQCVFVSGGCLAWKALRQHPPEMLLHPMHGLAALVPACTVTFATVRSRHTDAFVAEVGTCVAQHLPHLQTAPPPPTDSAATADRQPRRPSLRSACDALASAYTDTRAGECSNPRHLAALVKAVAALIQQAKAIYLLSACSAGRACGFAAGPVADFLRWSQQQSISDVLHPATSAAVQHTAVRRVAANFLRLAGARGGQAVRRGVKVVLCTGRHGFTRPLVQRALRRLGVEAPVVDVCEGGDAVVKASADHTDVVGFCSQPFPNNSLRVRCEFDALVSVVGRYDTAAGLIPQLQLVRPGSSVELVSLCEPTDVSPHPKSLMREIGQIQAAWSRQYGYDASRDPF